MKEELFTDTSQDVFSYITSEISNFQALPISVAEGYEWSMYKHIKLTTLYKNSQFETGNADDKPFKNIIRPILNLQYRAEGFDVKDIVLFVNDQKNYHKSFLVRKYHEKWARENGMDTFIDDMVETYVDFGGALAKKVKGKIPEIVPWGSVAFCDQTDILSGPICIKHFYSPDQLKDTEDMGWGNSKNGADITIDELITMSESYKSYDIAKTQSKTPGRYIEIYELHGVLPDWWLKDDSKNGRFTRQLQVIGYYTKASGQKQGVTLFKGKEDDPFKFVKRDKRFGTALGVGGAEELFESQVWTNYDMIRIRDMLDAASKVILQTSDGKIAARQNVRNLDSLSILQHGLNEPLTQVPTTPVNLRYFDQAVQELEQHARTTGAAQEAISGDQPQSGTPFKSVELQVAQSESLHKYRQGQLATFLDEIYRDWIIPQIVDEINKGQKFLSELDLEEMQEIAEKIATNQAEKILKEKVLNGEMISGDERETLKGQVKESFRKGGSKKFIELIKNELEDSPVDVYTNIAGKQKYLSQVTDKLTNIFRMVIQAPQILQQPPMAKLFNEIIESSGLSPVDFSGLTLPAPVPAGVPAGQPANQPLPT